MNEYKIKYMVQLKDDFYMPKTIIKRRFCGSLENINGSRFYFRLHGNNGLVIIPHDKIDWMAPSSVLFDAGYNRETL